MAVNAENFEVVFANGSNTTITFTNRCSSYAIWSDDNDYRVEEDADATAASHLIPKNTYVSHAIPCKTIGVWGNGGGGTVHVKVMWQIFGVHDQQAQENIGGIHVP